MILITTWVLTSLPTYNNTKKVVINLEISPHVADVKLSNAPFLTEENLIQVMNEVSDERNQHYTKAEVQCLARNIYFEARDQSILGQYYVAWVTMNRVKDSRWKNDVCQVVWQRKQFSWTHDGKSDRPREQKVFAIAKLIAEDTLYDARTDGDDLSQGALYYHADYTTPYWSKYLVRISKVDSHIFYK